MIRINCAQENFMFKWDQTKVYLCVTKKWNKNLPFEPIFSCRIIKKNQLCMIQSLFSLVWIMAD